MINIPQNFYKQLISQDWPTGTGNFYVDVKPTVSQGYMTISPASTTLREIVFFTATGTDGTGDYITISTGGRGKGGTTEQTHIIGEPVRMNVGAETIQEISDDITAATGNAITAETTAGETHSLTTVAGEVVMVWAKGSYTGTSTASVISISYNAVEKDRVTIDPVNSGDKSVFSLMYTETPGAATANITVAISSGSLSDVDIMVMKIKTQ
jgi:hypothetical protein